MKKWERVVVGVDGSESSKHALAWAADQAREHDATLEVITAWTPPMVPATTGYAAYATTNDADFSDSAELQLTETVKAVLGDEPDVPLRRQVLEGHPASLLIAASEGADLVAVGCRGHGGFTGMLLGSVSQHLTAHARCPVVVVR